MNPSEQMGNSNQISKLLFLAAASLLLSLSMLLSIFAPSPIALAAVFFNRVKAYSVGAACGVIAFLISPSLGFVYLLGLICSIIIAEIVKRNLPPIKWMVIAGLFLASTIGVTSYLSMKHMNVTAKQIIVEQIKLVVAKLEEERKNDSSEKTTEALMIYSNPEKSAEMFLEMLPSYIFVGVFFVFWANLFIVIRSRRLLLKDQSFPYSEKNILNFKVPENLIWIVIPTLVFAVWGDEYIIKNSSPVAMFLVYCFGVFYFFQGFGILIGLLDRAGIYGLFRTLIVMFIVISMNWLLAVIGLFDMWVDFSRFLQKKSN